MSIVMYAVVSGPEWEDVEYFVAEGDALHKLVGSPTQTWIVLKYICENGRVFNRMGTYSVDDQGRVVYNGTEMVGVGKIGPKGVRRLSDVTTPDVSRRLSKHIDDSLGIM